MKQVVQAVVVAAALAASSAWGISVDPAISYTTTTGTVQPYTAIGIPFYVNSPITVVSLGAFDNGANGLSPGTSIRVEIFSWSPGSFPNPGFPAGPALVGTTLTNTSPSVPGTGSVWAYVTPLTLSPGWYMLYASGFNASDPVILTGPGDYSPNTFGGAVSYGFPYTPAPGVTFFGIYAQPSSAGWLWASTTSIYLSGGTFGVPEPSTYALMGTVGLALYLLRRRKKAAER